MQRKITITFFVIVGFLLTISLYLLVSQQHLQVDLPRPLPTFSIDSPPSESLIGSIATLSGVVLWESRSATKPLRIHSVQKLQQGESVLTSTGSATLVFPGIVQLTLAHDTGINIIQTLPASFVLQQTKGEAVFTISSGKIPVALRALDLLISTNSATLSVRVDANRAEVAILVEKGNPTIAYEDTNFVTQILTLSRGQTFYFNNNTKKRIYNYL